MKTNVLLAATAVAAITALSGAAVAQTAATATTDLNIRSGPGPEHEVIGAVDANGEVTITGCLEGSKWCTITYEGTEGWAYSDYLTGDLSGSRVVVTESRAELGVPVATYEAPSDGTVVGAAGGAVAGALIAGPIGAVVGGAIGAAAGTTVDPSPEVRTYVTSNPGTPVYLEGEVVVGAAVPDTVELRTVPDYEYSYAYVNGQPVLIEPSSRQIVYVVR